MFGTDLAKIQKLLRKGIPPNIQDKLGRSPLMTAIEAGNFALAKIFLNFNADPNLVDFSGRTAVSISPPDFREEISSCLKARQKALAQVSRKPKEADLREPELIWTGGGWKPKDRKFDFFVRVNRHRNSSRNGTTTFVNSLCPRGS
jgi:ankyrin repeat protein